MTSQPDRRGDLAAAVHSPLRRAGQERDDPDALQAWFASEGARLVVMDPAGRHHVLPAATAEWDPDSDVHLGRSAAQDAEPDDPGEHHWFARRGESTGPSLRELAPSPLMTDVLMGAAAVLAWHDTAPACERCGGATRPTSGGFVRECSSCGAQVFPRQDPAVIVAVVDDQGRLLLGHQRAWAPGRVSVLAGFVEAGESAEQACGREVLEEVGLELTGARYLMSQPWPFPRSLMLGFVGHASGEPVPDGIEIEWARWYTPGEFRAEQAAGTLSAPGPLSVGGRMIRAWLDGAWSS